jgi:hypothetical protein
MENFKSQLNLDALQEIAISNVLTDEITRHLIKSRNWPRTKKQEIAALSETMDRKINEF